MSYWLFFCDELGKLCYRGNVFYVNESISPAINHNGRQRDCLIILCKLFAGLVHLGTGYFIRDPVRLMANDNFSPEKKHNRYPARKRYIRRQLICIRRRHWLVFTNILVICTSSFNRAVLRIWFQGYFQELTDANISLQFYQHIKSLIKIAVILETTFWKTVFYLFIHISSFHIPKCTTDIYYWIS